MKIINTSVNKALNWLHLPIISVGSGLIRVIGGLAQGIINALPAACGNARCKRDLKMSALHILTGLYEMAPFTSLHGLCRHNKESILPIETDHPFYHTITDEGSGHNSNLKTYFKVLDWVEDKSFAFGRPASTDYPADYMKLAHSAKDY